MVTHSWDRITMLREWFRCSCEHHRQEAYVRTSGTYELHSESGDLGGDHRVEWRDADCEVTSSDQLEEEIYCRKCFDEACRCFFLLETEDQSLSDFNHEWRVNCADCGRENQFAWLRSGRGGRI